jgi:acylphosphatase
MYRTSYKIYYTKAADLENKMVEIVAASQEQAIKKFLEQNKDGSDCTITRLVRATTKTAASTPQ